MNLLCHGGLGPWSARPSRPPLPASVPMTTPLTVRGAETDWTPLYEDGVDTRGLSVKVLRHDEAAGRAPTVLLRFDAGASYPNHRHPAGEEVFVLAGDVRFGQVELRAGDYLYTPPGGAHSVYSKSGCVLLLVVPEAVEVL